MHKTTWIVIGCIVFIARLMAQQYPGCEVRPEVLHLTSAFRPIPNLPSETRSTGVVYNHILTPIESAAGLP